MDEWFQKHDPGTQQEWKKGTSDTSDWREVDLPGTWRDCGIAGHEGVTWIQREFEMPEAWARQMLQIDLGTISDTDTTWLNGVVVGRTHSYEIPSRYKVPPVAAKPGRNVITVRITNAGGGGIQEQQVPMQI